MPTPPTARRLSTRNTPQTTPSKHAAGAAAAAALRSNTPTSVKDRIRQWQDQGGGVLPATTPTRPGKTSSSSSLSSIDNAEVAEPISTRIPENDSIPKAEPAKTTPKKAATVRRWADPAAGQWVREKPRSSSTPRKRVISDEHWKKNRAGSPKVGESAPGTPRARARTRRLQSQEQSSPQYHTPERDATQTKKRSSAGRRSSGREALDTKEEEDSVRVTGASSGSRKISYEDDIVVELESTIIGYNKTDRSASPSPPPKRKSSARHQDKENYLPTEDDGRGRRKTSYAEALEVASQVADGSLDKSGSQRSRKGGILGQIFSRSEPAPAPAPRVPTIEAWLDDQTDPFIDNSEPQVDVPAPLQTRPSRRRVSKEPVIPEDETLREPCDHETELKQRESHRRRRRRTRPSLESTEAKTRQSPQTEVQQDQTPSETAFGKDYAAENSPSTLRRRGAARGDRSRSRKRLSAAVNAQDSPASQMASPLSSPKETEQHVDQLKDLSGSRRRRPPTGGRQLSTIESIASAETCPSNVDPDQSYVALMAQGPTELKRRLTTHEDLISVLSMPRGNSRKIRSARSVRGTRPDPRSKEINPILQSLAEEEEKYMRELKTLVDGVIPVLLQCMLSKSDMSAAAGLFGATSGQDTAAITKPIMDMGITLERIKALHKRIPMRDANSLLSWAQGANKVYIDYIRAWRMGFQDVVINLAPAENAKQNDAQSEGGMARDSEGDVIDAEGKKADVAHLLKRPLVRLKHLSKTFQQLSEALATPRAEATHKDYLDLVELARRRSNEERARLEDEAAAAIDPTKARDSRSLAILPGVTIDKTRKVRARDYFDLTLHHSSGQRIDCQAELLLRENQTQDGPGGDVLLCEIDVRSRWLLFPPLELQCLSARAGDIPGEIVVMIRGASTYNGAWHELVSLRTEDEETLREWLQMLGSDPYPPKMVRSQSFINRQKETSTGDAYVPTKSAAHLSRTPSPTEVDVPIGEPSVISMVGGERRPSPRRQMLRETQRTPASPSDYRIDERPESSVLSSDVSSQSGLSRRSIRTKSAPASSLQTTLTSESSFNPTEPESPTKLNTLRRKPARLSRFGTGSTDQIPSSPQSDFEHTQNHTASPLDSPNTKQATSPDLTPRADEYSTPTKQSRPTYERAPSSTPSRDLPSIPRVRQNSPTSSKDSTPLTSFMRDQWASISGLVSKTNDSSKLQKNKRNPQSPSAADIQQHREVGRHEESHPVPPPHGSPTASEIGLQNVPVLKAQPSSSPEKTLRRRSSSPLKHEYAPSTSSNSLSDSDFDSDSTSDTSEDELEAEDIPGPLIPLGSAKRKHHSMPPPSRPTLAGGTLAPSDSASQAPYRTVPVQDPKTSAKTIATAFYWSDKGCWNPIHPDESSIIVSPGLIEVYEMTAAHSGAGFQSPDLSSRSTTDASGIERPLIGLELTPLVPLRRGTALDISIRSPPVERSRFKGSNNIMLRSRNTDECDVLYAMINHARINNPTYIALQNARPSYQPPVSFNTGGTQGARHSQGYKRPTSWFGGGRGSKPSYRASSAPTGPSIGAGSENSVGTVTSALRRLSGSGVFNLSRSSVLKKANRASAATSSLYSSDSGGTGGGPGSGTATPTGHGEASMGGVNNLKIRLYIREDQNKWRDIGAARLTILPGDSVTSPPATPGMQSPPPTGTGSGPSTPQLNRTRTEGPRLASATFSPHRSHGNPVQEKRVLITSSKKTPTAITLLDVTLHESCFERVARTGIAVSVWEEHQEGIVKEGGVNPGKAKVYMVQCAGEAEAAWVFNLVGRARY